MVCIDDLIETNKYLDRNIKFRLAFREYGTCLGCYCQSQQTTDKERAVDLKTWADTIITAWDPYIELSISEDLTPEDLRPITRVMYAAALTPGGMMLPCPSKQMRHAQVVANILPTQLFARDTYARNRLSLKTSALGCRTGQNWHRETEIESLALIEMHCGCVG